MTARALSGLSFVGTRAFSRNDIWVTALAGTGTSNLSAWLVHFNGARWTRMRLPWKVNPEGFAADGQGGLWLTAEGLNGQAGQAYVLHRTASGRWTRTSISARLIGVALIPGTASLWGVGWAMTKTGADAAIWAYGKIAS